MDVQHFYDKGPHPSLWAGPQAARGTITISTVCNHLSHHVIFTVHTQFMNVTTRCMLQCGQPQVGDPWFKSRSVIKMVYFTPS